MTSDVYIKIIYLCLDYLQTTLTFQDEEPLINLCYNLGCIHVKMLNGEEFSDPRYYAVFLNGSLLGVTHQYVRMVSLFRYDIMVSI